MSHSWADTDPAEPVPAVAPGDGNTASFEFEVASREGVRVVRLAGSETVPAESVEAFVAAVAPLARPGPARIALDLSAVEFFGPGGIDALIQLSDDAIRCGGRMVVFGVTGVVRDVFQLAGLDVLVGVFSCEDSAVTFLSREGRKHETWH